MEYGYLVICLVVAYLFGSVPFALVIGKTFYKTDVRQFGSKNLGGTNAGRVLGKKVGALVIFLDATKSLFAILFAIALYHIIDVDNYTFYTNTLVLSGLFAGIGHCYPVFAQFKGGKSVSTYLGFLAATNFVIGVAWAIGFWVVLLTTKYVSLGSIISSIIAIILVWLIFFIDAINHIGLCFGITHNLVYAIVVTIYACMLIYRHKPNIIRLLAKNENKVKWLGKKKEVNNG